MSRDEGPGLESSLDKGVGWGHRLVSLDEGALTSLGESSDATILFVSLVKLKRS